MCYKYTMRELGWTTKRFHRNCMNKTNVECSAQFSLFAFQRILEIQAKLGYIYSTTRETLSNLVHEYTCEIAEM